VRAWAEKICGMTTREKAHRLLDELPESEVEPVIEFIASRREEEPAVVGLPEAWKTFEDGTPQPNWVALIREDRDHGH
jgi:hypothetical protein